ncbi:phosphoribosylglycinamide formyltransferase [Ectobacillus antri]|jgi:phosphoribosylglycinamide formyltransferase-1|uniref:Phosphoribosylglycinamide formyltransferase n=1 Tax=Ectobacillus antri TaxID=2486280 RepID=A0ABT6H8L2_9BACI|nr:phosphoribosylglycinamide formyltransferase [Ectobacillus antri]MDG4658364.1 phosphoribosylglycinamide formyltransferase [Ectobacillus antri]MDG5755410.1 phosphoribosylglycinamide formyltransferase [Ectobacillus antri]
MKIAVFASGNGSNFQAMIDAMENGALSVEIGLLVCDKPGAMAIERAKAHSIPTFVFAAKSYASKEAFETDILEQLRAHQIEWIFLAGYMRLIGTVLLEAYKGRIVNIHPSLLPAFPGKDAVGQALEAGVKETGVTIHFVDEGMDTGPVIAQAPVPIEPSDTHKSLHQKIQALEHTLYIQTIQTLVTGVKLS